jgi:hypothetical protein
VPPSSVTRLRRWRPNVWAGCRVVGRVLHVGTFKGVVAPILHLLKAARSTAVVGPQSLTHCRSEPRTGGHVMLSMCRSVLLWRQPGPFWRPQTFLHTVLQAPAILPTHYPHVGRACLPGSGAPPRHSGQPQLGAEVHPGLWRHLLKILQHIWRYWEYRMADVRPGTRQRSGSGSGSGMFYIRLRPSTAIGCGTKQ